MSAPAAEHRVPHGESLRYAGERYPKETSMNARVELAGAIIAHRFQISKLASRYDLDAVDTLLDEVARRVAAGESGGEIARTVVSSSLGEARGLLHAGYRRDDVDEYLEQLVKRLDGLAG
ncbi:hypothetical protein ACFSWE_05840 [Leucobacter albus]|uniref:DivIVA domain-containing protein n=1 Tax=Leucobacter albus TaxID=272210 RepID=A0ABW3TK67_9MICO